MSAQELIELDEAALAEVAGGAGFVDGARSWFNWAVHGVQSAAYGAYREAVNIPTAAFGGWQLAGTMYGANTTLSERFRAMRAVHGVLAASPTVPSWARRG
jgi:hypothetical protein